jgi:hypothetical protein
MGINVSPMRCMPEKTRRIMAGTEIEQAIISEAQGLSYVQLREILDFIRFIKLKEHQGPPSLAADQSLQDELEELGAGSLAHLEQEFSGYRELYPHE